MSNNFKFTISSGLLNIFGASPASQAATEEGIRKDWEEHHCFYTAQHLHNHLNHQLLACYDLGASEVILNTISQRTGSIQRPINLHADVTFPSKITENNWSGFLGADENYAAYLHFFDEKISKNGVQPVINEYLLSDLVNFGDAQMMQRFLFGVLHPLIQLGFGIEFNCPPIVAQAFALACTEYREPDSDPIYSDVWSRMEKNNENGELTILEIFSKIYESPTLKPVQPYDSKRQLPQIMRQTLSNPQVVKEITDLVMMWRLPTTVDDDNAVQWESVIEELFHISALLLFATGKTGRKPRLDFFLTHPLITSVFLPTFFAKKIFNSAIDRARVLRYLLAATIQLALFRGLPKINCKLVMSYNMFPRRPSRGDTVRVKEEDNSTNPWPAMIQSAILASDVHVSNTLRSLLYAQRKYGTKKSGEMIGAFRRLGDDETLEGAGLVDGTLWVRCAGVLMDTLGWITAEGEEEGHWDFGGVGWEDSWVTGDK